MHPLCSIRGLLVAGSTCLALAFALMVFVSGWSRGGIALCIRDGYVMAIANGRFGAFDSEMVGVDIDYTTFPPPRPPRVGLCMLDEVQGDFVFAVSDAARLSTPQLWPVAAFAVTLCIASWWIALARRPGRGCCRCCGYDLAGNTSGVCPECGAPIAA